MTRLFAVLALCAILIPSASAQLLTDDFNADTSANYAVLTSSADTAVTFVYDYSADGIPPAPNTTDASTLGVKMEANIMDGAGAAVTLQTNQNFADNYIVSFDAWVNANGPFPAGGGGSTEFITSGVGGDGTTVNLSTTSGSGGWFAATGEGGSSRDYRAYKDAGEQFAESGQFDAGVVSTPDGGAHNGSDPYYSQFGSIDVGNLPVQGANNGGPAQQNGISQPGSFGFAWHEVLMTVNSNGGTGGATSVNWSIDGLSIATLDAGIGSAFSTDGAVTLGYGDFFSSVSDNAALSFGLIDNLQVVVPEPSTMIIGWLGLVGLAALRRRS